MLTNPDNSVVVVAAKFAAGWDVDEEMKNFGRRPPEQVPRRRLLRILDDEDPPRSPEHRATRVLVRCNPRSCADLRMMLGLVAEQPQLLNARGAPCMSRVMEVLMSGPRSGALFDDDQPDDARDECVRLLLEFGAHMVPARCNSPVMLRIIRKRFALARVAAEGMVAAHHQPLPQH
ncbi:hypothetical protein FOA52_007265 [Chlamydomonas sp. UWO 241]|nr:hypothetical protein FOA52_007265 [Chlamydomonas sp. UWO 241]